MEQNEIILNYLFELKKNEKDIELKQCINKYINRKLNYLFQLYCNKIRLCEKIITARNNSINNNWEERELENICIRNKILEYHNILDKISLYYEKNYYNK